MTSTLHPSSELPARTVMPLEQYLRTVFHPDRDYVDGMAEERNLGEYEHGKLQLRIATLLGRHEADWGIDVVVECRLQVRPDRFRIPDVMALRTGEKIDRYPRNAPLICIEVLSPEDTWQRLRKVVDDYLQMGVAAIWVFDPQARTAFACDAEGFHKAVRLSVPGSSNQIDVDEIFSILG